MANYWIAQENGTLVPQTALSDTIGYAVQAVPARNEVFVNGNAAYNEQQAVYCVYADTGKFTLARTANIDSASSNEVYKGIAVTSTHVFNVGYSYGAGSYDWLITKYDFTGTLVASARYTSSAGANADLAYGCVADATYLYVAGYIQTGTQKATLIKFDLATLTQQYGQRMTSASGGNCRWLSIAKYDTSLYLAGYDGGYGSAIFAKYNDSGTLQWQKSIIDLSVTYLNGVATNSDGTAIYTVGTAQDGTRNTAIIIKFDSSGNVIWSKKLYNTTASQAIRFYGLAVDASENIYVCGSAQNSSTADEGYLVKYNSSGTLQWQRRIYDVNYQTTANSSMYGVSVDNLGSVYVTGYLSTPQGTMITMKVADDGTGTGLYSNVYYNGSSYGTEQTGTVTISNGTLSDFSQGGIVDTVALLSASNYTYTENV